MFFKGLKMYNKLVRNFHLALIKYRIQEVINKVLNIKNHINELNEELTNRALWYLRLTGNLLKHSPLGFFMYAPGMWI